MLLPERLAFNTSKAQKETLRRILRHEGLTVSEWFQEQLEFTIGETEAKPSIRDIDDPHLLSSGRRVLSDLKKVDWSFSESDTGYLSHSIHPYPGKFIPQIPRFLIARLSTPGELVLDPFGGSGTSALEALLLGRRALSIDANPIGELIGRVKTAKPSAAGLRELRTLRASILGQAAGLPSSPEKLREEFGEFVPPIPNLEKWFPPITCGELAFIRSRIARMTTPMAKDVASLALSRIILKVSFQDSETRYASKPRPIEAGFTLASYLHCLETIERTVLRTATELRYGIAWFQTADLQTLDPDRFTSDSVDLVVTSPPYGNAHDYHLYHRFRLFWLGWDPRDLGKIEIGSHLRHQKEGSGFRSYLAEMRPCLKEILRLLRPGRYAALVLGTSVYEGTPHDTPTAVAGLAKEVGFQVIGTIERNLHRTKRSFAAPGRRLSEERIVLLRKPPRRITLQLEPPAYRRWPYEDQLRLMEAERLIGASVQKGGSALKLTCSPYKLALARRLSFSHTVAFGEMAPERTWQAMLENGVSDDPLARKDPKYATHGLHPYKGKFYPQLAKALMNIAGLQSGAIVLDPFCGSGTTLLEGRLNGLRTFGCDLHPLAAKTARAKVGILDLDPAVVAEVIDSVLNVVARAPAKLPDGRDQFEVSTLHELGRWFPEPVLSKMNWLLGQIRGSSSGILRDFLEVVLSSLIRDVSQQDPADLRIRRRKRPIKDAKLLQLFQDRLTEQRDRLEHFWCVKGYSPHHSYPSRVVEADSRNEKAFTRLGLGRGEVDLVLTSPPYATALPYLDTDRLSLAAILGISSSQRRQIEGRLIGSREITTKRRKELEGQAGELDRLPNSVSDFISDLASRVSRADVGFRRRNMPALLIRFFHGMAEVLQGCYQHLRRGGMAMIVIGDNSTTINGEKIAIRTSGHVGALARHVGLEPAGELPITVTTENLRHIRHAITRNVVLSFRKP